MKFLAIALLAVCLIQGHSAQPQFAALRNLASSVTGTATNAVSAATNAAKNAASTAQSAAANAASTAQNALSNARSTLSDLSSNAENVINGVTSGSVNLDSIRDSLKNLSPEELLETISGAEELAKQAVENVQGTLDATVNSAADLAKAKVAEATSSWNSDVAALVNKAASAGIDVSKCAVNSVTDLGAEVVENGVGCVTKKVSEAAKLLNNIIKVPKRAAENTVAGVAAYRKCSAKSGVMKAMCHATDTLPVAYKSLVLVKDTVSYTTQSVNLVTGLQSYAARCAAEATTKSALKAVTLSKNVVSCIQSELTAASA
ncbi:Serine--tRNA ligase [Frankliniella fusca]|uniref:Serine--tRNA ligase n=1 Tax=Frankliniella fusca TaxID=407009 RepID=A0AAE1GSD3_9NEOP|nr:Serine--tRNA ligase [Frankliniella fusca]